MRIFSVLTEVSGREEHADISLISPKITGVVPISGASTTHPVGLYGRCGETGGEEGCVVLGVIERERERGERERGRKRQTDRQTDR